MNGKKNCNITAVIVYVTGHSIPKKPIPCYNKHRCNLEWNYLEETAKFKGLL
jgi:hypothetical protein